MPSRSSRRKSDSRTCSEQLAKLLHDGSVFRDPSSELLHAVEHLRTLGIIDSTTREFVRCANQQDGDFSPTNAYCPGRVFIDDGLYDSGGELRCPDCERTIFPDQYTKRRYSELRSCVQRDGVLSYVRSALSELDSSVKQLTSGVFRLEVGGRDVTVCIIEYCDGGKYLSREWAMLQSTCFIAVNHRDFETRFLDEEWVIRVSLADVVAGHITLKERVRAAADAGAPADVRQVSIPICGKGALPVIVEPLRHSLPGRHFVVEVGSKIVRVDGEQVIAPQAGSRLIMFSTLWQWFLDDLRSGRAPDQFRAWPLAKLIEELEAQTDESVEDESKVRRVINNMQSDIAEQLKRTLGSAVDREDIIQTCPKRVQTDIDFGYRLNPFTVIARPFQADLS